MAKVILPGDWQKQKQKERFIQENMPEILDNIQGAINLLITRCDVIDECLRMLGIDDDKFKLAVNTINEQQVLLQQQAAMAQKLAQQ